MHVNLERSCANRFNPSSLTHLARELLYTLACFKAAAHSKFSQNVPDFPIFTCSVIPLMAKSPTGPLAGSDLLPLAATG